MRKTILNWTAPILCVIMTGAIAACSTERNARNEEESAGKTAMALSADMSAPGDVVSFRYTIDRVTCGGESFEPFHHQSDVPLMGFTLVGGTPGFDWSPVADGAEHFFSDLLLPVEPGCYDISAQPLTEAGGVSVDCFASSLNGVFIQPGKVNEIVLISQCQNDSVPTYGDIGVVLNFPPAVQVLQYDPNKHIPKCQEQTICVTAKDPEHDPLQFEWTLSKGDPVASGPTLVSQTLNEDNSITECRKITPGTAGGREFTVKVYDMMVDVATGNLIRYEDYFTSIGDPKPSHGEYILPSYAHEAANICEVGSSSSSSSSSSSGAGGGGGGGNACNSDVQCASGFCVDGVCCDTACTGTCEACTTAKKGSGVDGVCGPIQFDTDPDEECYGGACDGNGTCKFYNGVPCANTNECLAYCVDGVCCGNICSGTCESCSAAIKGNGVDGACGPITAGTDPDGECSGGLCNGAGVCDMGGGSGGAGGAGGGGGAGGSGGTGGGPLCDPAGTVDSQYCQGYDLIQTVEDGNCNTYQVTQTCNATCNPPANGAALGSFCSGMDLYGTYANGSCGSYNQLIQANSATCGGGATCWDGQQNQGEAGIDCGGPCAACATCSDGTQNQGEAGIDCGGPCAACAPFCGDLLCNGGETCLTCFGDCGPCVPCAPARIDFYFSCSGTTLVYEYRVIGTVTGTLQTWSPGNGITCDQSIVTSTPSITLTNTSVYAYSANNQACGGTGGVCESFIPANWNNLVLYNQFVWGDGVSGQSFAGTGYGCQ